MFEGIINRPSGNWDGPRLVGTGFSYTSGSVRQYGYFEVFHQHKRPIEVLIDVNDIAPENAVRIHEASWR